MRRMRYAMAAVIAIASVAGAASGPAPGGRDYLARVPGVAQAPLDDAALAAVLNWLLEHFDHGHVPPGFAPYSADEVGQLRKQPLVDVEGTRARLLGEGDEEGRP